MPVARSASFAALVITILALGGVSFDVPVLTRWWGDTSISLASTVVAMLLALAILLTVSNSSHNTWIAAQTICAFALIGIFWRGAIAQGPEPGGATVAPSAALGLALLCISVFLVRQHLFASQWLAIGALLLGMIGVLGYLYNVEPLLQVGGYATMSAPAAFLLFLLAFAALDLRSGEGIVRALTDRGPARILARRFLPFAALTFLSIHWIGRLGFQYGLYNAGFQTVVVTLTGLIMIALLTTVAIRQIQAAEDERDKVLLRFQTAAAASGALIYEWQPQINHVERISGVEALTGYRPDQIPSTGDWWRTLIHPDDFGRIVGHLPAHLEKGRIFEDEYRIRRKDGEYIYVADRFMVIDTEGGKLVRAIGSTVDITERRQREENLRLKNEDLRQFTYAASHDLQEPLRMVAVFTQLLARSLEEHLTDPTRDWMRRIVDGTRRMSELLRDLRSYMEVAQQELTSREIASTGDALASALQNLELAVEESHAVVTSDVLPKVPCPPVFLSLVFQNLIANAIKYAGIEPPRIHISAKEQWSEWVFSVRDHGIGIAPEHHELIFGIFKRLDHEGGGTGMGLAICTRITERCGGRIWVESQLGAGATFFFSLPK